MKSFLLFIIFFLTNLALQSQSLSVFNVDAAGFPAVKAKFFAYDEKGVQITNLSAAKFRVTESGNLRTVTYVSCPNPKQPITVSIAMSIDNSSSMGEKIGDTIPIVIGKETARRLAELITIPPSEIALQSCNDKAFICQDFTQDKNKYYNNLNPITSGGGNDFAEQLLAPQNGLLNIAKKGINKKVAVIYTDGLWTALKDNELQKCKDICANYNITFFAIIFSRPDADPNGIKTSLKSLCDATGGYMFDGITSLKAAEELVKGLQKLVQGGEPCSIEWQSEIPCIEGFTKAELMLLTNGAVSYAGYQIPLSAVAKLEFNPEFVKFLKPTPGIQRDTTVTVKAINSNFNVTNITSSDSAYTIKPTNFTLNAGQTINLTVSFIPPDSGYSYAQFTFENTLCTTYYPASGGFPGKRPLIKTLKLIQPNGGQKFVVGMDTLITWFGVLPGETVVIDYSIDSGATWKLITDTAKGLSYKWRVPKTPGNQCLARVTTKSGYGNCNEVRICEQVWMGCNLDVDHYRNGDLIPEIKDTKEWEIQKIGAWCYYLNDSANGAIYGKLYNWYAILDPRGLAPEGWHIPTNSEFSELKDCLQYPDLAGGKLKEEGTEHWKSPNTLATNLSGFVALPGGCRDPNGTFLGLNKSGYWWTTTEYYLYDAWSMNLLYNSGLMYQDKSNYSNGLSVRCLKD